MTSDIRRKAASPLLSKNFLDGCGAVIDEERNELQVSVLV